MTEPTVFLVDDDPGVLKALTTLLAVFGYNVKAFSSAAAFLGEHDPTLPGCAVFDVSMPELDGLELLATLREKELDRPVIFITGVGDIPTSVKAMKAGAIDFLTKPVNDQELLAAIECALEADAEARRSHDALKLIDSRFETLTRRELEVLRYVIAGKMNKQIAYELGTVLNTIKVHRGRVMRKLGVKSVADLVRVAQQAGVAPVTEGGRPGRD